MRVRGSRAGWIIGGAVLAALGLVAGGALAQGDQVPPPPTNLKPKIKPSIRLASYTKQVNAGSTARVTVLVSPDKTLCSIVVKYSNGKLQTGLKAQRVSGSYASWSWKVPTTAKGGRAGATVACVKVGKVATGIMIVPLAKQPGQAAPIPPPKITVSSSGFSFRARSFSSSVNWGVALTNPSGNDAKNVDVLVNFTDASNLLIGSATARVGLLPARSTFYAGGSKTFQTVVTAIAGIEVTAHAQAAAATNTHFPKTQNVRAVADPKDPAFVSSIQGEVVNDSPNQILGGGFVYAVAVNASGAIVGGSSGGVAGPAPPGARLFFKISSTSSIPIDQATSIQVSVIPSYRAS